MLSSLVVDELDGGGAATAEEEYEASCTVATVRISGIVRVLPALFLARKVAKAAR